MISAKILLDSVSQTGHRLVTWELTYPRFIHSEFMTHRVFSRNAASSRAIPIQKMIRAVYEDPAVPVHWGANQKGMQARAELSGVRLWLARRVWLCARYFAIAFAWLLSKAGLHKQIANRVLEPWLHITVIASSTEHENFFKLRAHPDAQPEFQELARKMKELYERSEPRVLATGEWHMPLVNDADRATVAEWFMSKSETPHSWLVTSVLKQISVARCARVSYVTHMTRKDIDDDVALCERLSSSGHWSPFEHVAAAQSFTSGGNFRGFKQFRKEFGGESGVTR